ncbi:hypothetical protein [Streptomyces sp. GESEQ-35]|uniref:hypothetical protein n=1 Tax=Streptomyces sp. GESEQ-35 TaxID=2812657 RepID=UPI001B3358D8|nr:hypothetical protein [Streptomyces sp. GESEQ-35]
MTPQDACSGALPRTTDRGLPPSSRAIVSPYDTAARHARHGHIISWSGFSAHDQLPGTSQAPPVQKDDDE